LIEAYKLDWRTAHEFRKNRFCQFCCSRPELKAALQESRSQVPLAKAIWSV